MGHRGCSAYEGKRKRRVGVPINGAAEQPTREYLPLLEPASAALPDIAELIAILSRGEPSAGTSSVSEGFEEQAIALAELRNQSIRPAEKRKPRALIYPETCMDSPDESLTLISAGKVQGTPVYSERAEALGEIYDVMLEKRTGRISYAILTFGGILGVGKKYIPLPWDLLSYDVTERGYVITVPKEALANGPTLDEQGEWHAEIGRMIEAYYEIYKRSR